MNAGLWNRKYIFLIVENVLICFSFYMITTILTTYLVGIGISMSWAGTVVGLFSITSLIIRPFTGYITDNYNKKYLLVYGCFFVAIAIAGYVLTSSLSIIVVFRIIHGIAFGINSTAIVALASEYIPGDKFNEGIGYLGLGQIIASAVGPGFGVWIMNRYGIQVSFVISAMFSVASVVCMLLFQYEKTVRTQTKRKKIRLDEILSFNVMDYTFIGGVYSFMNGAIASFLVLYAAEKNIMDVSVYFTVCAVFLFLARPISGKIVDRFGIRYVVYPGIILSIVSLVMLANADTLMGIICSAIARSLAQGSVQPSVQAACIKRVGLDKSGVATSTYYLGGDVGQGLGPIIGGFIVGSLGYEGVFYSCIMLMVIALFVFAVRERQGKIGRETAQQGESKA